MIMLKNNIKYNNNNDGVNGNANDQEQQLPQPKVLTGRGALGVAALLIHDAFHQRIYAMIITRLSGCECV